MKSLSSMTWYIVHSISQDFTVIFTNTLDQQIRLYIQQTK